MPEILGHGTNDVVDVFHKAAWLAGPVGVLRARAAQRGRSAIFDVPRAGALMKHHLSYRNDPLHLYRLPGGVCSVCLAHYREDFDEDEMCLWCENSTVCRACHLQVSLSREDPRVKQCFDPSVWGEAYANAKAKRHYRESPEGNGHVMIPGCLFCVREKSLMPESQVRAHWYRGFERALDEIVTDEFARCVGGYFYREFPRYHAGHCPVDRKALQYPPDGWFAMPSCAKGDDGEGVVNPDCTYECTSLDVLAHQQAFRAWSNQRKTARTVLAWGRLSSEACEAYAAFLQCRAVGDLYDDGLLLMEDAQNSFRIFQRGSNPSMRHLELEWVDMQRGADDEVALTAYSSVLAVSAAQGSELGVGSRTQMPYPSTRDV